MSTEYFLENKNIESLESLVSPAQLHREVAAGAGALRTVARGRHEVEAVLRGDDSRLLVVVGPCSVHDTQSALEYAQKLCSLRQELSEQLLIVMRVYFEKPRTTVGWKGLINDPRMDGSFDMEHGLRVARRLLVAINEMGLPVGTEALDPLSPQYLGDLVSWSAIGARTTESQTHREMASGLSTPVGFKNGTDGNLKVALNAMLSAARPHAFLGVDARGRISVVRTHGNAYGHVILRGGVGPNYGEEHVQAAKAEMVAAGLEPRLVVDCSHGNSEKDYRRQPQVFTEVLRQRMSGERSLLGVMLESHLVEGQQSLGKGPLTYGQSVTDACLGWEQTEHLLRQAAQSLRGALSGN